MAKKQHTVITRGYVVLGASLLIMATTAFLLQNSSDQDTPPPIRISASDSTNTFSFTYPDGWTIEPYEWVATGEFYSPTPPEPDWSKESKPITLSPKENQDVDVHITTSLYGVYWNSFEDLKAKVKEDFFATTLYEGVFDDTHEALFVRVDYLGPPDAKVESFTDHRYYYDLGDKVLSVDFRQKYHHDWYPEQDVDYSKYLADFQSIVDSLSI